MFFFISHCRRKLVRLNVTAHPRGEWGWCQLIEAIRTPVQAPRANAIVERVIGRLHWESLDHVIVINERHLLVSARQSGVTRELAWPGHGILVERRLLSGFCSPRSRAAGT